MDFRDNKNGKQARSIAWLMAFAGFFPLALFAIIMLILGHNSPLFPTLIDFFKLSSALVLSYLGGARLGLAVAYQPFDINSIRFSILAPLAGWISLLFPDVFSVLALLVFFCAMGAWDSFYVNAGKAPPWYGSIRTTMTFLFVLAHVLALVALSDGISYFLS